MTKSKTSTENDSFDNFFDFIVVGAQKAGTTKIFHELKKHENIHLPMQKELHLFDNDHFFHGNYLNSRGFALIQHSFTELDNDRALYGDITPKYMFLKTCLRRIHDTNSKTKIIVILRNPLERAISHWKMEYSRGSEKRGFYDAVNYECADFFLRKKDPVISYFYRGMYYHQIQNIRDFFPLEKVLVLLFDDLSRKPEIFFRQLYKFLELEEKTVDRIRIRPTPVKREIQFFERELDILKIPAKIRHALIEDISATEVLIGDDLGHWKNDLIV